MWTFAWTTILVLCLLYALFVWWVDRQPGSTANEDSRANYLESLKTMVEAAGVSIAVLAALLAREHFSAVWIVGRAIVSLTICVVLSVAAMFTLSALYDKSRSVGLDQTVPMKFLWLPLTLACGALFTFLLGFAYLARLTGYL
jgi:hypothetical protein